MLSKTASLLVSSRRAFGLNLLGAQFNDHPTVEGLYIYEH